MFENPDSLDYALNMFQLLGSRPRLKILCELHASEEPLRAAEIAQILDASRPATSYHLSLLQQEGLVLGEDRGCQRFYSLSQLTIHRRLQVVFPHLFPEPGAQARPWSF